MKNNIAIILPSYKRKNELELVLKKTNFSGGKFIVVANYPHDDYADLVKRYSDRAIFIDETSFGRLGVCGAYNKGFEIAAKEGFQYCVLFADDVIPCKKNWLKRSIKIMEDNSASIGIFSSDEGHYGSYGWNVIKDAPIGHFFIARINDLDMFFDSMYKQYVIDLEIIVRTLLRGKKIVLLPVRVNHLRSPLNRETYGQNYDIDLATFVKQYPEYNGWLNSGRELFIPEGQTVINVYKGWKIPKSYPWPAHLEKRSFGNLLKYYLRMKND